MGHRTLGMLILAAGGLLAALVLGGGGSPSPTLLVVSATLVATGLGLILAPGDLVRFAAPGRPRTNRDELRARLELAEQNDDGLPGRGAAQHSFAVAKDEDGGLLAIDRSEVDAYFQGLLQRWCGPLALSMSSLDDDGASTLAAGVEEAATELRGDILQAERYLGALLFSEPSASRPYVDILDDLDALLRRLGDSRWGERHAGSD